MWEIIANGFAQGHLLVRTRTQVVAMDRANISVRGLKRSQFLANLCMKIKAK